MINKARKKAARKIMKKPQGPFKAVERDKFHGYWPTWISRAFIDNRYVVMISDDVTLKDGTIVTRAMIQRHDNEPIPNHWKEMQSIKNSLFGDEVIGIEYYPKVSQLIDDKNIYWLWIIPESVLPIPTL